MIAKKERKGNVKKPEFESNHAKDKAKKEAKRKAKSKDDPREGPHIDHYTRIKNYVLEYSNSVMQAWIPAVYHCRIRDRLLAKSKTCAADVYTHPRDCSEEALDKTAFLQSQKDWNLERDDGWTGVEVLFEFDKERFNNGTPNPTYEVQWLYEEGCIVLDLNDRPLRAFESIPLTVSSKVEGALMEAIIRYDDRISVEDFWARLPGICHGGPIFKSGSLTERRNRFRLTNCVTSWGPGRKGGGSIQKYLESRMSAAMMAANSTRDMHKLSKAEEDQAQAGNAGKHKQNAGGYSRDLKRKDGPAPPRRRWRDTKKVAPKPRTPRPKVVHAPNRPTELVWDPNLDPQLIDLNGHGPLPTGAATSPQGQPYDQHIASLVRASPYLPIEVPPACYGNPFNPNWIYYDQIAPTFEPSMSSFGTESMLGEQELSPGDEFIDWSGGESDGQMEWTT